jgi:hypothetical protein
MKPHLKCGITNTDKENKMATKAEKVLKTEKMKSTGTNPTRAAIKYVNAGLASLGLKPAERAAMKEKLIPIVENRIKNDRGRTASRAAGIVNRETKARVKKASESM